MPQVVQFGLQAALVRPARGEARGVREPDSAFCLSEHTKSLGERQGRGWNVGYAVEPTVAGGDAELS